MKKKLCLILVLFLCSIFTITILNFNNTYANEFVYLGGMPAGFTLESKGAYVAGLCDVITDDGLKSPAKDIGIMPEDIIYSIDGLEVNNALDIENALKDDSEKVVLIDRLGCLLEFNVKPAVDINKKNKLGLFIKDAINGIGTITYLKEDSFASLGHPILDNNGRLMPVLKGQIFDCNITGVVKGEKGKPGELHGSINKTKIIGDIYENSESGVFGRLESGFDKSSLTKIETGSAKMGDAQILTTINGSTPKLYNISIIKCDNDDCKLKNYVVRIDDENLIENTNGILQGMSGSPIIQDGKLVGAITHVFINDSLRGYGISISNMLNH